jgi:ABC-type bacteriocin/lantibiotic exporter with double-glycine peptidase domain
MTLRQSSLVKGWQLWNRVFGLLIPVEKTTFIRLLFLNLVLGILELSGLLSVLPIIFALKDHHELEKYSWWSWIRSINPFPNLDGMLLFLLLGAIGIYLIKTWFNLWLQKSFVKFSLDIAGRHSEAMLLSILNIPLLEFQELPTGKGLRNVVNIPQFFAKNVLLVVLQWVSEIAVMLVIFLALLIYNPLLLVLLMGTLGVSGLLFYLAYRRYFYIKGKEDDRLQEGILRDVIAMVGGIIDWRLLNKQEFVVSKIAEKIKKSNQLNVELELAKGLPNLLIEITALVSILVIFIYTSLQSSEPRFWVNILAVYALAAFRIMPSIKRILSYLSRIKIFEYTISEIENLRSHQLTENNNLVFEKDLILEDVSFWHQKSMKKLLSNISLEIKKGDCIGIFGPSGTGKSTLLNILMGLIPPKNGRVLVDGISLHDPSGIFAYVRQDVYVMEGSVVQNIALGIPEDQIDMQKIDDCLHWSSLRNWVNQLPEGIFRPLSESGKNMSGGERQRLAIARSLYADAKILVFDEPIGSLDPENASQVLDAIQFLKKSGKTIIIVSHQPEALIHCDRIFELRQGHLNIQ